MFTVHDDPDESGITVEQLLAEELIRGSLIGGQSGLANVVTWCVPAIDDARSVADVHEDVTGVALFLAATRLAEGGADLIRRLSADRVSAVLAWGERRGLENGIQAAADAADAHGMPLLLLPTEANFRRTSRLIATKVLAQSTHVLEYGTRVHRTLGDVFARGGGLSALVQTMSRLSGTTVLVLAHGNELLATGAPSDTAVSPLKIRELLAELGEERRKEHASHGRPVVLELPTSEGPTHVILAPITVAGDPFGALVLVEPRHPVEPHDVAQHVVVAEQGVTLTASELLRQQSVREAEERARNDFVHALLHARFTDQLELAARAEHHRFPLDGRFAVFIVTAANLGPDDAVQRRKARDAARRLQALSPDHDRRTFAALVGPMLVIVQQLPPTHATASDVSLEAKHLVFLAEQMHRILKSVVGDDVRIAYGQPGDGASGVARSYREARTTEVLGRRVGTQRISSYADLRIFAAIQAAAMSTAGQTFASDILGPLKQADGQTGNLEQVVLAYIEESGNLNATARRLHLHRNTMLYKLDRASRALQMDVRSTEAQFMVWLAHHITALSDVVVALDDELSPPT